MGGMAFLLRVVVTALATAVAAWIVPGITVGGVTTGQTMLTLLGVAVVIGVINAFVKPLVTVFSGCLVVLTLGLFLFVINALMLMLSSWVSKGLGLPFFVDGFWSALFGSIVISLVSALVSGVLRPARPAPRV